MANGRLTNSLSLTIDTRSRLKPGKISRMRKIIPFLCLALFLAACGTTAEFTPNEAAAQPESQPDSAPVEPSAAASQGAGRMFAIELTPGEQNLVQIDADTAVKQTIFAVPENAWLNAIDYQPQRDQFVWAYAPVPPEGEVQYGFSYLYLWRMGDAEPTLLLEPGEGNHLYFNPVWSPDGESIYFSHVEPLDIEAYTFTTSLKKYELESGEITMIAQDGIWPAFSPDGQKLAYVFIDPDTGASTLMVADVDGQNSMALLGYESFAAIDVPVFSPDGEMILVSAVEHEELSRPWWDILLGVQTAAAHNLPSDWYQLPAMGGDVTRLTEIDAVGLYGRFAPQDPSQFAFASQSGLFTLALDGQNLELFSESSYKDSLVWAP